MDDFIYHVVKDAPEPVAPFSHGVEIDGWVFLSGQIPQNPLDDSEPFAMDIETQTHQTMANLKTVLAGMDLSLGNVVSARVFLTDFYRDYEAMNAVYQTYFPESQKPARTCIGVTGLARFALLEIDVIARRT